MKRLLTLLTAIIIFSSVTVSAQTRRRSTRPAVRAVPTVVSMAERQGAIRVADEVKTMTRFLYLLGGIVKGIEALDDAARGSDATPALQEQAKKNKLIIKNSIQSIRERLDKLEIDFRNTPELQRYYIKLAGSAAGAAAAEQQVAMNQIDQAGKSLLNVVNRLTDVLVEMR